MCRESRWLIAIVAILALVGCESVNSRHVLGERINDDLSEKIDGPWTLNGEVAVFHQAKPGELRVAGLDWDDEQNKFDVIEVTIIVSRLGDHTVFNLVRPDDPDNPDDDVEGTWYQYLLADLGENTLTIRGAETEPFAKAVESSALAGRVDIKRDANGQVQERHVWIEADKAALDAFVRGGNLDELFGEAETLERITDDD
jgi:hypothetical protein